MSSGASVKRSSECKVYWSIRKCSCIIITWKWFQYNNIIVVTPGTIYRPGIFVIVTSLVGLHCVLLHCAAFCCVLLLRASGLQQVPQLVQIDAALTLIQLRLPAFELFWEKEQHQGEVREGQWWAGRRPCRCLLLWMTICSSFLLADARSRIFWSMVLAVTSRYTTTGLVCPMRWQRSWACRSAWGF